MSRITHMLPFSLLIVSIDFVKFLRIVEISFFCGAVCFKNQMPNTYELCLDSEYLAIDFAAVLSLESKVFCCQLCSIIMRFSKQKKMTLWYMYIAQIWMRLSISAARSAYTLAAYIINLTLMISLANSISLVKQRWCCCIRQSASLCLERQN